MPPDREHHLVGGDARSVRQMRGEFLAVLVDLVDGAAGQNGDAVLLHLAAHMGADVLVEAAQDVVAAIDHRHVGAEAGKDAGEFQRDIAAALDQDALRQRRQMKHLVGGDHVLDAGNRLAVVRRAAGGDQHIFRSDRLAGAEPKRMRVLEHRARLDDARAGFFHIGGIGGLQPRDLLVLVGDQGRPVEGRWRDGPAKARRVLDLVMDMRGIDQELFRHAPADHAGAAHPVFLGDHDPRAMAGGDPGRANAARPSSNDEQIDIELGHVSPGQGTITRSACRAFSFPHGIQPMTVSLKFCAHCCM